MAKVDERGWNFEEPTEIQEFICQIASQKWGHTYERGWSHDSRKIYINRDFLLRPMDSEFSQLALAWWIAFGQAEIEVGLESCAVIARILIWIVTAMMLAVMTRMGKTRRLTFTYDHILVTPRSQFSLPSHAFCMNISESSAIIDTKRQRYSRMAGCILSRSS